MVDGSFTRDELLDRIQARLEVAIDNDEEVPYGSAKELLDALIEHSLLLEFEGPIGPIYRSRTAEGIRLLFRLKQIFPPRSSSSEVDWRAAPDLIADFRLILRQRWYPRRHLNPDEVQSRLSRVGTWDGDAARVLETLLGADSARPFELADFQLEAAERVLQKLSGSLRRSGTIVCAGTGSGKTLAFYLPALLELARLASSDRWTRCLALYPRNELLKDQLGSALEQVLHLNTVLRQMGRPVVTFGAYYGDVPKRHSDEAGLRRKWSRTGSGDTAGWQCPYLSCPRSECAHVGLVWRDSDRLARQERLVCSRPGCDFELEGDEFVLTRDAMHARPPDLLFSGLDMLNQNISAPPVRPMLGIGLPADRRPRLVLLDEAHAYSGTYGAQAALLIRRWKKASRSTPHFVGLSATLEDARRFFADLIGEPQSRVEEVKPRQGDMEAEGQEVLLALRGDPVSKTSLLSASIQTAMLLARLLDPRGTRESLIGTKLFAFTDDLDVTNRLFHNLLDAEGWDLRGGRRQARPAPPLAHLRSPQAPERDARLWAGQSWDAVEKIGHVLSGGPSVVVGRTSSQDAGVDREADSVVATASLEVGFDDPEVGVVLQHKAPRDAASFLQRKGRAGRPRGTRPWTVVVLSDFGRDRIAYQGYEQLFSPELRPRYLPIRNRHVLRMQAVLVLMDWLTERLSERVGDRQLRLWPILSAPPQDGPYLAKNEKRLDVVLGLVKELLTDGVEARRFRHYLESALPVGPEVIEHLLWAPPRSLMLAVLPTIVRRLERRWKTSSPPGKPEGTEPHPFWSPLPEFIPAALFDDLNLPEVTVSVPPHRPDDVEHMPILQAMREFAPGRVSRRFGVNRRDVSHWLPVPDGAPWICLVEEMFGHEGADELDYVRVRGPDGIEELPCFRPREMRVERPPTVVGSTSNARLMWSTQLLPRVLPKESALPAGSPWRGLIRSVGFFTHALGTAIELRRFALGSRYELRLKGDGPLSGTVAFHSVAEGTSRPVAVGYALDVDALRLEVQVPDGLHELSSSNARLVRSLRTARFAHLVKTDPELEGIANDFERDWIVQVTLSALLLEAMARNCSLEEGVELVFDAGAGVPLEEVLGVIFQSQASDASDATRDDRRGELGAILSNDVVAHVVRRAACSLWASPDESWAPWLKQRLLSTLGAAVLDASQQLCAEMDAGDLCVDIRPGVRGREEGCAGQESPEVWLTETSPGGSGVIEALATAYAADPRRFFHLVEAALAPSDFEEVDVELSTLCSWLSGPPESRRAEVVDAVEVVRSARTHRQTVDANEALRSCLERSGLAVTHPVLVAMQARVLRPGGSPATDGLLYLLLQRWQELELRLGVEVDARVVAYSLSNEEALDDALAGLGAALPAGDRRGWRYGALYGLLWPRGAGVRSQMLSAYNPFLELPPTDRWLVLASLSDATPQVSIESSDWRVRISVALVNHGVALLTAPPERRRELRAAIQQVIVAPLDSRALLVQPAVTGATQEGRRLLVRLEVREGIQ